MLFTGRLEDSKKKLARQFLARAKDDVDRAERTRSAYITAARDAGLSDAEIGRILGIDVSSMGALARAA